jgi:hypothetical protein
MSEIWLTHSKLTREAEEKRIKAEQALKEAKFAARLKRKAEREKRGPREDSVRRALEKELIAILREDLGKTVSLAELSEKVGKARTQVGDTLRSLVTRGLVCRSGAPKRLGDGGGYFYFILKGMEGDE